MRHVLSVGLLSLILQLSFAQGSLNKIADVADSLVRHGLEQKLIPGLALVLINKDSMLVRSFGVRNVERGLPVDTTTLFQLGSVGKLFTVIGVLQQVEAGKLDLYADVNQYLAGFSVASMGRPITLFDLLTHTAGFNDRFIGYLARSEHEVKPLAEHLNEFMPTAFQGPGIEINYSNYSYALAGHIVERASGMKFISYVRQRIFLPMGMHRTTYALPDNYSDRDAYASGYRTRDTFEPVACYPRHAIPAGSALSCASDMSKLLSELMHPTGKLLSDSLMALLRQRQFANHPKLMGYTMGLEEQHIRGHHGVGKGGAFTGFLSELVLFPDEEFGLFVATNTQTDNFLELFHRELLAVALPKPETTPDTATLDIDLDVFTGVYRSERYNHTSVEDLLALYQGKLSLGVSDEGELTTYQNGDWQYYRAVDKLLFQNTRAPEQYLAFVQDDAGRILRLHTNINIAGFYVPASFSPVTWYDDPVMINEYYLLVPVVIFTFIFVPFYRIWVMLRQRRNPSNKSGALVPNGYVYLAAGMMVLYMFHLFGGFMYLARNVNDFYFGVPGIFAKTQQLTWLFPVVVAGLVVATVHMWQKKPGTPVFRVYYTLVCLCSVIHLFFLYRWHFIGLNV